ncbi:MAG: TIGR00341 family protein [Halanaerobiaceae bacterium]
MQIVHATFRPGEGEKAVELLDILGIDIEDYKLISSGTGDLLIIHLLYKNTDVLLDNLTSRFDFENDRERSLVIFTADTVIPRDKREDKSSRESLVTYAQDNSRATTDFIMMVIASAVITSLGLILDNVAVIVGGMVIAPVLGPLLAITIGIVLGDIDLIKKGVATEMLSILLAVLVGGVFGLLIPDVEVTGALQVRMFPSLADLLIALSGGAAAAYALMKGHLKSALVGVMVAASLLPVMCTIGIGIAMRNPTMILGASLLLGGNFLGLLLSNMLVLYLEGLQPQIWFKFRAQRVVKKSLSLFLISVIVLSIPLGILTVYQFYVEQPDEIIKNIIRTNLGPLDYEIERVEIQGDLIAVQLYAEKTIERSRIKYIRRSIERELAREYTMNFKVIPVEEITM